VNRRLGVLISGRGSNLKAIIDAINRQQLDASIAVVISNRADAQGLDHAIRAGIETLVLNHKAYASRQDYDRALVAELDQRDVALVCLAGFMRIFSPVFVDAFPNRILNIHPSLLPKYPGLHPQQQALDDGATVSGATVHIVNKDLDAGPIVLQDSVAVIPGDTADTLAARILAVEHQLYPRAIGKVLSGFATASAR
jgi:phosphoribosylglycinamide formyltransferase 1